LERSLSTPEVGGSAGTLRARRHKGSKVARELGVEPANAAHPQAASGGGLLERPGSAQIFAITNKEWKYFWRDPQLKATLLSSLYIVIIFLIGPFLNAGRPINRLGVLIFTAPLAVFFSVFT